MFPIPDPTRLSPPRLPPSRPGPSSSFPRGLLSLGTFPLGIGAVIFGYSMAYAHLSSRLGIPAAILGLVLVVALSKGPILLLGTIEAIFYGGFAFIATGGRDSPGFNASWVWAGLAAAFFLGAAWSAWKESRGLEAASEGHADEGVSNIFFSGPTERPELPPELEPYVNELQSLYHRKNTFDYSAREEARAIGERINAAHGYRGMVTVCDTLRFLIHGRAARELEMVWDYIGEWRN